MFKFTFMQSRIVPLGAILAIAVFISGCNIFGWTAGDDNLDGYMARGREYMRDSEYQKAADEFAKAIEEDPAYADARYYHAKAVVLAADINVGTIIDELESGGDSDLLPLYSRNPELTMEQDIELKDRLYRANRTAYIDLTEIFEGRATGSFSKRDVAADLLIALGAYSLSGMRDTDQNGAITADDIYLEIKEAQDGSYYILGLDEFFDYNPDSIYSAATRFDTIGAHYFNVVLEWGEMILTNNRQLCIDIVREFDPTMEIDEIEELLEEVLGLINKYYVNTGGAGNPGEGDGDNDGNSDDEHWGSYEMAGNRDGDDLIWEDATCVY
ncbi:MAG: hypothetical protein GF307_13735 [candidate division Zixibacteria bacterium]|nr:hypothetical protein [candidate division Zixibacteria bacterium]